MQVVEDIHRSMIMMFSRKLKESGISVGELAERMGVSEDEALSLFNLDNDVTVRFLSRALLALGEQLEFTSRPSSGVYKITLGDLDR